MNSQTLWAPLCLLDGGRGDFKEHSFLDFCTAMDRFVVWALNERGNTFAIFMQRKRSWSRFHKSIPIFGPHDRCGRLCN